MTRKITRALANIKAGKENKLYLGNLKAKRDWGFAPEYVECQWRILQQDKPDDYVIGTGESHTVEEFVKEAFAYVDLDWREYVEIDPRYFRPTDVDYLQADITKAKRKLGWSPTITFYDLVKILVDAEMMAIGLQPPGEGKKILQTRNFNWTADLAMNKQQLDEGTGHDGW